MVAPSRKSAGIELLEPAPPVTDPEVKKVVDWMTRAFGRLVPRLNEPSEVRFVVLHSEPGRPREGQLVYADGTDWNPGQGTGLYVHTGSAWTDVLSGLDISTFMRTVLDDASGSAALVTLGIDTSSYTPTHTLTTNIAASTAYLSPYIKIDNYVIGVGLADIDCTTAAGTASVMKISIPIASSFTQVYQLTGVMAQGTLAETGELTADTNRISLSFAAQTTANHRVAYAYMYVVL